MDTAISHGSHGACNQTMEKGCFHILIPTNENRSSDDALGQVVGGPGRAQRGETGQVNTSGRCPEEAEN